MAFRLKNMPFNSIGNFKNLSFNLKAKYLKVFYVLVT